MRCTAPPILRKIARIAAWSLATAIVVLSIVPPSVRPETDLPQDVEHFAVFWATGLALAVGYTLRPLVAAVLVIFSGAVEMIQLLVPGRHARVGDFMVDALASIVGLITVFLVAKISALTRVK